MSRTASISANPMSIKELIPNIKYILLNYHDKDDRTFTIERMKGIYKNIFDTELNGNSFRNWLSVPFRGKGWDFDETIRVHPSCNMIEFKYTENAQLDLRGRGYSKHHYI